MDKITPYRHPLVTVASILLGFTLNVAANWISRAFTTDRVSEILIALVMFVHLPMYIIVIYRILNNRYPEDKAEAYYHRTLLIMVAAMVISFLVLMFMMGESYVRNRM